MTKLIDALSARTRFGEIMEKAEKGNTRFVVSRHGKAKVVILSVDDYLRNFVKKKALRVTPQIAVDVIKSDPARSLAGLCGVPQGDSAAAPVSRRAHVQGHPSLDGCPKRRPLRRTRTAGAPRARDPRVFKAAVKGSDGMVKTEQDVSVGNEGAFQGTDRFRSIFVCRDSGDMLWIGQKM